MTFFRQTESRHGAGDHGECHDKEIEQREARFRNAARFWETNALTDDALQTLFGELAGAVKQIGDDLTAPDRDAIDWLGPAYERLSHYELVETLSSSGHASRIGWRKNACHRKASGMYYTPSTVARYVVEQTVAPAFDDHLQRIELDQRENDLPLDTAMARALSFRVLDPAVGSGVFLLHSMHCIVPRLMSFLGRHGKPSFATEDLLRLVATHCLVGFDNDPWALRVATMSLCLALPPPWPNVQDMLACRDSLAPLRRPRRGELERYDVVVGNPPFLSFSGREAKRLPKRYRTWWAEALDADAWPSLHGMFVRRAMEWARHGIGLVLPGQVGQLDGYRSLRAEVGGKWHIADVRYWGESIFPAASTPVMTLVAAQPESSKPESPEPTSIRDADGWNGRVQFQGGAPWLAPSPARELAERLQDLPGRLDQLVADIGVHTGNCAAELIVPESLARKRCDPGRYAPLLEGKQVGRYDCRLPDRFLRLDVEPSESRYFRILPEDRYRAAQFVIRQTASYPIVGPRRGAVYFRNSLLGLFAPPHDCDVRYVVGILNSKLFRFLYRQLIPDARQQRFPQVKIGALRSLPVVWPDRANRMHLAAHDAIVASVAERLACGRDVPQTVIGSIEGQIDRLVYELYELTPSEIEFVKAHAPKPVVRRRPAPEASC